MAGFWYDDIMHSYSVLTPFTFHSVHFSEFSALFSVELTVEHLLSIDFSTLKYHHPSEITKENSRKILLTY